MFNYEEIIIASKVSESSYWWCVGSMGMCPDLEAAKELADDLRCFFTVGAVHDINGYFCHYEVH